MRNRVSHGYFDIDLYVVWNTVTRYLPTLQESVTGTSPSLTRKQKTRGEQPSGSTLADGDIAPVDLTSTDYAPTADPANIYKEPPLVTTMPGISLSPNRSG